MKYIALIPVKSLHEAKSRLSAHLTQAQRATLMLDMLQHVISVLYKSEVFSHVTVVSADRSVLDYAQERGALARVEEQAGHNPALSAAATRELAAGADALLTISADLPLLCPDDIRDMMAHSRQADVVLAPSRDGTGTNALLTRPPLVIPYLFGPGSRQRHQTAAEQQHLVSHIFTRIGLGLDIDTIEDIQTYQQYSAKYWAMHASQCL